jgi:hypothetical protein
MTAPEYTHARPENPGQEAKKDDDWHMSPCKQDHRDVGARQAALRTTTHALKRSKRPRLRSFRKVKRNRPTSK